MQNGTMFVSFRSPSYKDLQEHNCILQKGGICESGNTAFNECMYEKCTYKQASLFAKNLGQNKIIDGCWIMPPQAMLPQNTAMQPLEFMELLPPLYERTQKSDYFVRFCIDQNNDSFWTLLERELWRRHCSANKTIPIEYQVKIGEDGNYIVSDPIQLPVMTQDRVNLYTRINMYIKPEAMAPGHFWGRYSRTCFIIKCHSCNDTFLISKQAFGLLAKATHTLNCPCCNEGQFNFKIIKDKAKKYPYRFEFVGEAKSLTPVMPDFIIDLLLDDNKHCPKFAPIIIANGEKFPTDLEIQTKAMLLPILLAEVLLDNTLKIADIINNKLLLRYFDYQNNACYEKEIHRF